MKLTSDRFRYVAFFCCLILVCQQVFVVPILAAQDGLGVVSNDGMPSGGNVVAGSANIQTTGNALNINSVSDRTIINWDNFSVANGNAVNFNQPGLNSAVLNRVISANPSAIHGAINSNGNVYLVNPNGILVGPTGVINTNGFTASTFDIANSDFMSGNFSFGGNSTAGIINQGLIQTGAGGVNLLSNQIVNHGLIESGGNINLITGGTVQLKNGGSYTQADQGTVMNGISETAGMIQNNGTIRATGALEVGGEVYLVNPNGNVLQQGLIAASKSDVGGKVVATGQQVELNGATIDVSGDNGGGEAYVGGGFQGNNPEIQNAATTVIDADSSIEANALANGDGGFVVVWSDQATDFAGSISARGGNFGGNGGFIEVSGMALSFAGQVDTTAALGSTGSLLLDPVGIQIISGPNSAPMPGTDPVLSMTDGFLNNLLIFNNIVLATTPTGTDVLPAGGLPSGRGFSGVNDDNIVVSAGTALNTGSNTLFFSTSTVDLYSPIIGNISGGPFTDPSTVNVFNGASIQNGVDLIGANGQVNIGAGTFDSFVVNQSGLTIAGAGALTIVETSSPAITVNANGTTLSGLNLVGTGAAGDIGILLDGTATPNLNGITIDNVTIDNMEDGIISQGVIGDGGATDVLIDGVTITNTFNDGIRFAATDQAVIEILNSDIGTSGVRVGGDGIQFAGLAGGLFAQPDITLDGNTVFAADNAIEVSNLNGGGILDIAGGTYDGTDRGLLVNNQAPTIFGSGDLEISDSTFVAGAGGIGIELTQGLFGAGLDITFSNGIQVNNVGTGLKIAGSGMDIVGDTLSDMTFTGQTGDYIQLGGLAELLPGLPNIIDASGTTFDGVAAVDLTPDEFFDVEGKLVHFPDNFSTGLIDLGPLFVVSGESIQLAVNAAGGMAGPQTVAVANGTYGGSVEVWVDDLTITGQGPATIIDANSVDAFANNGDVNVGFEVTNRPGGGNGVGDVTGVTIGDFGFTSFSLFPSQINTGISLGTPAGAAIDTTIQDSTFNNLQGGIRGRFVEGTTTIQDVNMVPLLFSPTVNQGIRFANDLNNVTINIDNANIIADVNAVRFAGEVNNSEVNIAGSNLVSSTADSVVFVDAIDGSDIAVSDSSILGFDDGINTDEIIDSSFSVTNNDSIIGTNGSGIEFDNSISNFSNIQVTDNTRIIGGEEGVEFDTTITGSLVNISNNTGPNIFTDGIRGGLDAIQFKDAVALSTVLVGNNLIVSNTGNGISVDDQVNASLLLVGNNNIGALNGDGIFFADEINLSAVGILANRISADEDAIQFAGDINLSLVGILLNQTFSDGRGIAFASDGPGDQVINDSLVFVGWNRIDGPLLNPLAAPDFGIRFDEIGGASTVVVRGNNVIEADEDALLVQDQITGDALLRIRNNTFGSAGNPIGSGGIDDNGIDIDEVNSTRGVEIFENTIFADANAIQFDNDITNANISIFDNTDLVAVNGSGISFGDDISGTSNVLINSNSITSGGSGISQTVGSSIVGDTVFEISQNMIELTGNGTGINLVNLGSSNTVLVNDNSINGGDFGIVVTQQENSGLVGLLELSNLMVSNSANTGITIRNLNATDSLNVTLMNNVTIAGGATANDIGLVFDGLNLSLTGNTLGNTSFVGTNGNFIELRNGALFEPGQPTVIDATGVNFDGIDSNTLAGFLEIESRVVHFIDDPTLGLFWPGFEPLNDLTYDQFERYTDYFDSIEALLGSGYEGSINFSGGQNAQNSDDVQDGVIPEQNANSYDVFGN